MDSVRLDRWLNAARVYKSRTLAADACSAGHVAVNGNTARGSHPLRVGDELRARAPGRLVVFKVLALAEKRRSAKLAQLLYEDRSPPPPSPDEQFPDRGHGIGRPTKGERRALQRFRGDFY